MNTRDNTISGVLVPLLQAFVTGLLLGTAAGVAFVLFRWPQPGMIALGVFALTTLASWLSYRSAWQRRVDALVGIRDELQAQNLEASTVRVEVISDGGRAGDYLFLPTDRSRLMEFAHGLAAGVPLTTRAWTGKTGLFSPGEFAQLVSELTARGLVEYRSPHDHRAGMILTRQGSAVMRYLSRLPDTPHPTDNLPRLIRGK